MGMGNDLGWRAESRSPCKPVEEESKVLDICSADETVRKFGRKASCVNRQFVEHGSADVSPAPTDENLTLAKEEPAKGKEP